jgi:hypothetical protein
MPDNPDRPVNRASGAGRAKGEPNRNVRVDAGGRGQPRGPNWTYDINAALITNAPVGVRTAGTSVVNPLRAQEGMGYVVAVRVGSSCKTDNPILAHWGSRFLFWGERANAIG